MKNKYLVVGDEVIIGLGNGGTTKIDLEDLPKVKQFQGTWRRLENGLNEYVVGNLTQNGKVKTIYLHRLIMDCPKDFVVDHKNGNGLHNKKNNLCVVTQVENLQNLSKGAKSSSKSKLKNVFYDKYFRKWVVEVVVNGSLVYKQRFTFKKDAIIASILARAKYQPFSPEGTAIRNNSNKFPEIENFVEYKI